MTSDLTTHDARAAQWAAVRRRPGPEWLQARRGRAYERFEALGFPTVRDEAWRHTDVTAIARGAFLPAPETLPGGARDRAARVAWAGSGPRLVFVNGGFAADAASVAGLPAGTVAGALTDLLVSPPPWIEAHYGRVAAPESHAFTALGTALAADAAVLYLPPGTVLEEPVQVVYWSEAAGGAAVESHPRLLVVAGENAQACIVEVHAGEGASFSNAVSELVLGPGARVEHVKVQTLPVAALHTARTVAAVGRDAHCNSWSFAFGAGLARNEFDVAFTAPGGECVLDGLWIGGGTQHLDNQTFVDHAHPHCASRQLYKGILAEGAHGVFNGRVLVRPGAQQTNAHQTNRNLLLSEAALVDTKPQLEIFADDVQCTHGATIGRLDEDSLFYLRSRGIGTQAAEELLVRAFAYEIVSRVRPAGLRAWIETLLAARLPAVSGTIGQASGSRS